MTGFARRAVAVVFVAGLIVSACAGSDDEPAAIGRSTQIVVVSRKSTSSPKSFASVACTTSFCTSP